MVLTDVKCITKRRLRAVPPFRGFRFPGMRKERRDCMQTTHQEMKTALPTQRKIPIGRNRYACQSNLICSNYAINNFQTECWFYTGCVKIKVIELQRAIVSELLRMNEIFSSSENQAFSCWMICSSCQMDKKWANTNPIKNASQNQAYFHRCIRYLLN
jgi:hypothetical protein